MQKIIFEHSENISYEVEGDFEYFSETRRLIVYFAFRNVLICEEVLQAAGPGSSLELLKISFPIEDYKKHKLDEYFKGIKSRSSDTKIDYLELFLGELRKRGIKTRRRKEGPY